MILGWVGVTAWASAREGERVGVRHPSLEDKKNLCTWGVQFPPYVFFPLYGGLFPSKGPFFSLWEFLFSYWEGAFFSLMGCLFSPNIFFSSCGGLFSPMYMVGSMGALLLLVGGGGFSLCWGLFSPYGGGGGGLIWACPPLQTILWALNGGWPKFCPTHPRPPLDFNIDP